MLRVNIPEGAGLAYTINKSISFVGQWDSDFGVGGGVRIRF
jgi:hypothetical protein